MARQFSTPAESITESHQKNGFARVVGLRTIGEEGVFTVEVEVFIDESERNKIIDILNKYDMLNELPAVGNQVFDTLRQLAKIVFSDAYEGKILRNHMRQHPPKGGGFPEVEEIGATKLKRTPVARELVKSRIAADEWKKFIKAWREKGFSTATREDGTQLHDIYDENCRLCRQKFIGYRQSTQRKKIRTALRDPYGGFCCGDPVRPVELMHGRALATRSGLVTRDTQYSYESPTYVNFSLPDLANVIIRLYIPEIKEAIKKRFGFSKLDKLAFGPNDNNIVIPDPEKTDPRYLNRIVSLQHMKYAFPTNVAYKISENQPQWFIYNTEAHVNFGRKPLDQNPWQPKYDPAEEEGAPEEGLLDRFNKIVRLSLSDFIHTGESKTRICSKCKSIGYDAACSKCGSPTYPNVKLSGKNLSNAGTQSEIYTLQTGIPELGNLIRAFVPPLNEPAKNGPVCWGVAGRSDVQVVDLVQKMMNDQIRGAAEIYLPPVTATSSPIDELGNVYFMTSPPPRDLEDIDLIYGSLEVEKIQKPTNLTQAYQTSSLIKKTISYFPAQEEIQELKEKYGTFKDVNGKYGEVNGEYEFDDLLLWIDPEDIMALEIPPPFFDSQNRYIRRQTFEKIRDLYQSFRTEVSPKKRLSIKDEIGELKMSDTKQVYIWDWIINPMDPSHPVLIPDKDCEFKSILDDPQFQLWLSEHPSKGGAGCIWDDDSLDWKRVYYNPNGTFTRFNDPEFWKSHLPDLIQQDVSERTQELNGRETVIVNEILKLIAPFLQEPNVKKLDSWHQKQFEKLLPLEIKYVKNKKERAQKLKETVNDLNDRLRALVKDIDPELDLEERKQKIIQYQKILGELRTTKISLRERAKHIQKDANAWRVDQLKSPTRLTPPAKNGLDLLEKITGEKAMKMYSPEWWKSTYEHVTPEGQEILSKYALAYLKLDELVGQREQALSLGQSTLSLISKITILKQNLPDLNDVKNVLKKYKVETDNNDLPSWFFKKKPKSAAASRRFDVRITKFFERIMEEDDLLAKLRAERRPYAHEERKAELQDIAAKAQSSAQEKVQANPTDTKTTSDLKPLGGDLEEAMPGEPGFDGNEVEENWENMEDMFSDGEVGEDAAEEAAMQEIQQAEKSWQDYRDEDKEDFSPGQIRPMADEPVFDDDDEEEDFGWG